MNHSCLTRMSVRRGLAALFALAFVGCGAKKTVWQKVIDTGANETAVAIATDNTNLFVGGTVQKLHSDESTWLVARLTRDGNEVWSRLYKDSPRVVLGDIAAGDNSILFATGRALVQGKQLCLVACYRADGNLAWQKGLALGDKTWGMGICRLSGDRIAVCGMAGTEENADQMVAVLDAKDGKVIWTRNYDICPADLGRRIAADGQDNMAIVGQCSKDENSDIILMKTNGKGDTLWTRRYDSGGEDEAGDVAIDQFGNIVVTGTARVGDSTRCVILEYDPDGGAVRKAAYGKQAMAEGRSVVVTPAADIFVAGTLVGKPNEVLVYQYLPNALSVWERHYTSGGSASGADLVMLEDAYVVATVENKTKDMAVYRFSRPPVSKGPAQ